MAALGRRWGQLSRRKQTLFSPAQDHFNRRFASSPITGWPKVDQALNDTTGGRATRWLQAFEDYFGLTEIKAAQQKVIEAEEQFLSYQEKRRSKQHERTTLQTKLNTIRLELDKTKRGEERFLKLITEEYKVIAQDNALAEELSEFEEAERNCFQQLSAAHRESHEKERLKAERTKNWSLLFSGVVTVTGFVGYSITNYLRNRELRRIVKSSTGSQELQSRVEQLAETVQGQQDRLKTFVNDISLLIGHASQSESETSQNESETSQSESKPLVNASRSISSELLDRQSEEIINAVKLQDQALEEQMAEIKHLLSVREASDTPGNIVYVGPHMEEIMLYTEKNLEWKMKINSIVTVTMVYAGLAIAVPILYAIFKGGG
ncbi:coiled-coil domain-containing protein 51 [Lingula anatina]|uniref:Coiled-coil domain-containing protein 51 n=1 Tax=Lingula anatina TaxID=7574 RepID=A0A1S3H8A8_LINAN|nr:coiled-coil domain-containing protein 51 [Lingula anatina]|eukprot:XP_013382217.1 coiled-coil domain-containing protein 51 [Lingula anatina]